MVNGTSESILSSAIASANGTALLDIGKYRMPIYGSIQVLDAKGANILAPTDGPVAGIYGGDSFSVSVPRVMDLSSIIQPVSADNKQYNVTLQSTSSITSFRFLGDQRKVVFNVNEESTNGFTLVAVKQVLGGPFTASIDGQLSSSMNFRVLEDKVNGTEFLRVSYTHGPHDIAIVGTNVIPEFPSTSVLLSTSLVTAIITIIGRRILGKDSGVFGEQGRF